MAFTAKTTNSAFPWRPDVSTFHAADIIPDALILQCSTVSGVIDGDAPSLRVAYIDDDEATFVAEGSAIPEAEPSLNEVQVFTGAVSQLIRVSRSQYYQAGTAEQLAQSVGRALVKKADEAFLAQAAPVSPAVNPAAGILNASNLVGGGTVSGDLDELIDIVAEVQANGAQPSHIVLDPLGWAALRQFKTATDSNVSLVGAGTNDAVPMLLGIPLVVTPAMPAGQGLVLDSRAVVSAVGPVEVETSEHRYFEYRDVGLVAQWRIGQAVVRPDRLGTFTVAGVSSGS